MVHLVRRLACAKRQRSPLGKLWSGRGSEARGTMRSLLLPAPGMCPLYFSRHLRPASSPRLRAMLVSASPSLAKVTLRRQKAEHLPCHPLSFPCAFPSSVRVFLCASQPLIYNSPRAQQRAPPPTRTLLALHLHCAPKGFRDFCAITLPNLFPRLSSAPFHFTLGEISPPGPVSPK